MSRTSELFLRVREADEADFDKSLIRIHKTDKPPAPEAIMPALIPVTLT